ASGLRFEWTFQASTDLLCKLTDEEVGLLGRSGVSHIGFGTESGSEQVLMLMNKRHQRVPDMFEAARKCHLAGIRAGFNIILGFPEETEGDRRETLRVMNAIGERYDNTTFSPNIFTPYPAIPIWPELRKLGVKEPESLEAWAAMSLGSNVLPWLAGRTYRQVKRSMFVLLMSSQISKGLRRGVGSRWRRRALRLLQQPLRWRLKHQFFRWPFDLWLLRARNRVVMRRSLVTGRSLGYSLEKIC